MSWMSSLGRFYDALAANPPVDPPVRPGHMKAGSGVEIAIDAKGNFVSATAKYLRIELPVTEESLVRTSGLAPHPLHEGLGYLSTDPRIPFKKDGQRTGFDMYCDLLANWVSFQGAPAKLSAVLAYVRKNTVVADLLNNSVLFASKTSASTPVPVSNEGADYHDEVFKELSKGQGSGQFEPARILVRWKVDGTNLWEDSAVADSWEKYFAHVSGSRRVFCPVLGDFGKAAYKHPKVMGNAKLFSSNDTDGYTFRGRFESEEECSGMSVLGSHKLHSALKWLLDGQTRFPGATLYAVWSPDAVSNISLAPLLDATDVLNPEAKVARLAHEALRESVLGTAGENLLPRHRVDILGMVSNVDGRLAVMFSACASWGDLAERVAGWHDLYAWKQTFRGAAKGENSYVGVPSLRDTLLCTCAEGETPGDNLVRRMVETVVEGRPFPRDVFERIRRCVERRISYGTRGGRYLGGAWGDRLRAACGIFNGISVREKGERYEMALESERKDRDYLFGRLLAVADALEETMLRMMEMDRETAATRLWSRFALCPSGTWPKILERARVYKSKHSVGARTVFDDWLNEIHAAFQPGDFERDEPLGPAYLLGYYCQREEMERQRKKRAGGKASASDGAETDEVASDGGTPSAN